MPRRTSHELERLRGVRSDRRRLEPDAATDFERNVRGGLGCVVGEGGDGEVELSCEGDEAVGDVVEGLTD
jgi:hypothetical protein